MSPPNRRRGARRTDPANYASALFGLGYARPWFHRETVSGVVPSMMATSTERIAARVRNRASFSATAFLSTALVEFGSSPGRK